MVSAGLAGHAAGVSLSDFLEVGIHDTVIVGLLLVVGSTCVGAGLCACSLLCGSGCLVHLLEHLAQSFLLCLDVVHVAGLDSGADDYLTKPFLMQELLLRVQHILQRAYRAELSRTKRDALRLGGRSVDLNDALVTLPDGSTLALTATELALLRKLAENRGHIVTYDALCTAVWGADYYGYENSLNVHIRHLREKLEEQPSRPQHLLTVRSIGYKLAKEETA